MKKTTGILLCLILACMAFCACAETPAAENNHFATVGDAVTDKSFYYNSSGYYMILTEKDGAWWLVKAPVDEKYSEMYTGILDAADPGAAFDEIAAGYEAEPEGGERCTRCFLLRLEETARRAAAGGFDWYCTTLTVSPHKDAERINRIGAELGARWGVRWLPSDFKKRDGYLRSIRLAQEYGLYRQDWCGCEYSHGNNTADLK